MTWPVIWQGSPEITALAEAVIETTGAPESRDVNTTVVTELRALLMMNETMIDSRVLPEIVPGLEAMNVELRRRIEQRTKSG